MLMTFNIFLLACLAVVSAITCIIEIDRNKKCFWLIIVFLCLVYEIVVII